MRSSARPSRVLFANPFSFRCDLFYYGDFEFGLFSGVHDLAQSFFFWECELEIRLIFNYNNVVPDDFRILREISNLQLHVARTHLASDQLFGGLVTIGTRQERIPKVSTLILPTIQVSCLNKALLDKVFVWWRQMRLAVVA